MLLYEKDHTVAAIFESEAKRQMLLFTYNRFERLHEQRPFINELLQGVVKEDYVHLEICRIHANC